MASVKERTISDEVLRVLRACTVEYDQISIPREYGTLSRPVYDAVDDVLRGLGGKWHRGRHAHVFGEPNVGEALADAFYAIADAGSWANPQDSDYYPTPDWLAQQMIATAAVVGNHLVLEPSAGQGAIAIPLLKRLQSVHLLKVVEILPRNQKVLTDAGLILSGSDFLEMQHEPTFDRIIMNPPFSRGAAVKHVDHALTMLKPGGRLVAILPSSIMFRQDRSHRTLRQQIILRGTITPLPDETFKTAGTLVRTVMVVYDKPTDAKVPLTAPPVAVTVPPRSDAPVDPPSRFKRMQRR